MVASDRRKQSWSQASCSWDRYLAFVRSALLYQSEGLLILPWDPFMVEIAFTSLDQQYGEVPIKRSKSASYDTASRAP